MDKTKQDTTPFLLKYWHVISFLVLTSFGIVYGYANLQSKVIDNAEAVQITNKTINQHEVQLTQQRVELQNIKDSLDKIESQNEKLDNKIEKVLYAIVGSKTQSR